jgi:hypothetical protein
MDFEIRKISVTLNPKTPDHFAHTGKMVAAAEHANGLIQEGAEFDHFEPADRVRAELSGISG